MRSHDSAFGSGRQRKNLLRATASEAFTASDATFDAELVTAGVSKWSIGDTVEVKNYMGQSGAVDDKLLLWAYDDGTFELMPSGGGVTTEIAGSTADVAIATRTTAFSTTSNQTKSVGVGTCKTTDTNVFGSTGYKIKTAGTYYAEWNLEVELNANDQGASGTVATGVPEAPELPLHLVTTGAMRFRSYLYDSGGAYTAGTLLDEKNLGHRWHMLPNDDNFFSDPNFDAGDRYHLKLSEVFSVTQATLDALTNDEALFYLEGRLERHSTASGTATANVISSFSCIHLGKDLNAGGDIDITAAVAP